MVFRIAHISDTHLSGNKPYFVGHFRKVASHIAHNGADLVLHTGDISLDGSAQEDDLIAARRLHAATGLPLRFIPGNHDIGDSQDAPELAGPPKPSRATRERYLRHFGQDYWGLPVPGWRILAINDFLLGSNLAAVDEQIGAVRQAAAAARGVRRALFTHRPLFHVSPDDAEIGGRFLNPRPRAGLLAALGEVAPALIGCGHVHQFVSKQGLAGPASRQIWAPATSFVLLATRQPHYGLRLTGYVEHLLKPDGRHFPGSCQCLDWSARALPITLRPTPNTCKQILPPKAAATKVAPS